jgi:hypothetical protein
LALTSTPSIIPSSTELTCPVKATPGELSAAIWSDATKNAKATTVAIAIARKIRFGINVLLRLDSEIQWGIG